MLRDVATLLLSGAVSRLSPTVLAAHIACLRSLCHLSDFARILVASSVLVLHVVASLIARVTTARVSLWTTHHTSTSALVPHLVATHLLLHHEHLLLLHLVLWTHHSLFVHEFVLHTPSSAHHHHWVGHATTPRMHHLPLHPHAPLESSLVHGTHHRFVVELVLQNVLSLVFVHEDTDLYRLACHDLPVHLIDCLHSVFVVLLGQKCYTL